MNYKLLNRAKRIIFTHHKCFATNELKIVAGKREIKVTERVSSGIFGSKEVEKTEKHDKYVSFREAVEYHRPNPNCRLLKFSIGSSGYCAPYHEAITFCWAEI